MCSSFRASFYTQKCSFWESVLCFLFSLFVAVYTIYFCSRSHQIRLPITSPLCVCMYLQHHAYAAGSLSAVLFNAYRNKNKRYTLQQKKWKKSIKNRFPNFALLSLKTAPKREVHFLILREKVRTGTRKKHTKHDGTMGSMDLIWTSVSVYADGKYGPYLNQRVHLYQKNMSSFCIYFILYLCHILDIPAHKYDAYLLFL
jgi:hypothetical protein